MKCIGFAGLAFLAGSTLTAMIAASSQVEYQEWNLAQERQQVHRREAPTTWDREILEADKELSKELHARPFAFGVFPVPRYELVGTRSFRGAGNKRVELTWRDRFLLGNAFFVSRSPVNEKFIGDRADEVFFQILVLSNEKVKADGSNAFSQVLSRNHPHIIGQGQFKTGTSVIDYVAFQTADRNAYAIVNLRLFDLRAGRVVIVAGHQDGTLRSMQVETPVLASADLTAFDAKLLKNPQVVKFLDGPEDK
jgi:hypothetical protein